MADFHGGGRQYLGFRPRFVYRILMVDPLVGFAWAMSWAGLLGSRLSRAVAW